MQKFGLLLAFAALAGFSQAADPTYTWWNGQDDSMNVSASTTGTWTIGMNLNVNAFATCPLITTIATTVKRFLPLKVMAIPKGVEHIHILIAA